MDSYTIKTYVTHNEKEIYDGGSLAAFITIPYDKLVEKFGEPIIIPKDSADNKIDCEWKIEWVDGKVAYIYNYKDGKNYCGEKGTDIEDIVEWHIGCLDYHRIVVKYITSIIDPDPKNWFIKGNEYYKTYQYIGD